MAYEREREVAVRAADAAARLCELERGQLRAELVLAKDDGSPATVADFAAQAVITAFLHEAFPNDPIAAEESSASLVAAGHSNQCLEVGRLVHLVRPDLAGTEVTELLDRGNFAGGRERFWTVDPIDGTKGYLRGGQYCVAIALLEGGEPVLGVLACPALPLGTEDRTKGCMLGATRGQGSWQRPLAGSDSHPIRVDSVRDPGAAIMCEPVEKSSASHEAAARFAVRFGIGREPLLLDSQTKYALVARGETSIYLRLSGRKPQNIWDHAAGTLLVTEAGGRVSDASGAPLRFGAGRILEGNHGVLASNGHLHDDALTALRDDTG
jgi:3'(2'), 5'-bisphosphate nucleotidase